MEISQKMSNFTIYNAIYANGKFGGVSRREAEMRSSQNKGYLIKPD